MKEMTRYGMVIDLKKCVGCTACAMACKAENGTPPGVWWNKILMGERGQGTSARRTYLPMLCMHCEQAPCVQVCPTGASYKRPDGIVVVDYGKCMGCKYCEVACPYDARTVAELKPYYEKFGFTPYEQMMYAKHQAGVVEKCTFCVDRVAQGQEPACVAACAAAARHFGDLNDPNSEVSRLIVQRKGYQLLPELGTNPSVYYLSA
jgi:Fe-S-cluster-containing dehydrogenase component